MPISFLALNTVVAPRRRLISVEELFPKSGGELTRSNITVA